MDIKYREIRIQEKTDGTNVFTQSSWKDTEKEAEAMVRKHISADMKDSTILMASDLVLASNGSIGLKSYFSHDPAAERDYFIEIESIWYTEESGKPYYQSFDDKKDKWGAEARYWDESGKARDDADVDFALNIVFNRHGAIETSENQPEIRLLDAWEQYPKIQPTPIPPIEPIESEV